MIAAILFISFAVLLVAGVPIAVCLGSSSILAMLIQGAGRPVSTIMSSLPFLFSAWPSPSSSSQATSWKRRKSPSV